MRMLLLGILFIALGGVHGVTKDGGCPNDCSGNGYCIRGQCYCLPGFTSRDCSTEGCLNDCSDHGTCVNGVCQCTYGWVGHDCSARGCRNNCYGHGVCHIGASSVNCRCFANYTGLECEHVISTAFQHCEAQMSSYPFAITTTGMSSGGFGALIPAGSEGGAGTVAVCSGHGVCANNRCYCALGFTGVDCSQKICPKQCNGHGVCNTYTGVCMCFQGYGGASCDQARCPLSCSGRGQCNTTTGLCMCNPGFFGADCSPLNCEDQSCSGHGICVKTKFMSAASCNCTYGWTGSKCDVRICGNGWSGPNCDIAQCDNDCSGHGLCVARPTGAWVLGMNPHVCECFAGYTGQSCQTRTCASRCAHGGYCVDAQCVCVNDWSGPSCTIPPKRCPANCTNHGECHWGDCYCDPGYYGDDCGTLRRFTAPVIVSLNVMGCMPSCHGLHGVCVTLNITAPIPLKLSLVSGGATAKVTISPGPDGLGSLAKNSLSSPDNSNPSPTALLQTSASLEATTATEATVSSIAAVSLLREWYHQMHSSDGVQLQSHSLATVSSATTSTTSTTTSPSSASSSSKSPLPSTTSSSSRDTVLLQESSASASASVPHAPLEPEFFSMLSMPQSLADLFTSRLPVESSEPETVSVSVSSPSKRTTRNRPQSSSQSSLEPATEMASFAEVRSQQRSKAAAEAEARQKSEAREAMQAALMDTVRHTRLEFAPTFATDIHSEPFLRISALAVDSSSESNDIRPSLLDIHSGSSVPHLTLSPGRFLNAILSQLSYISSPSNSQAASLSEISSLAAVDDMQLQTGVGIVHVCYCRDGFTGLTCSRRASSSFSSSSGSFLDSSVTGAPS